jgi:transposase-like protein
MATDDQRDDDTPGDEDGPVARATSLTDRQRIAVELVLAGRSDARVARTVGVHRVTVTRWRLAHPAFRSAVSAGRQSAHRAAEQARRVLYQKALDRLTRELDEDGPHAVRAAMALVATPPPDPGPVESVTQVVETMAADWLSRFSLWRPIAGVNPYMVAAMMARSVEEWEPDDDPGAPDAKPGTSPDAT